MRRIRLAIQKNGRLTEPSIELLRKADIDVRTGDGRLVYQSEHFPVDIFFLRNDDMPAYLMDGTVDAVIVGQDTLEEAGCQVQMALPLGFGKCRLSIAGKRNSWKGIFSLHRKRIATSYPRLLREFLKTQNMDADIVRISGSVELAPALHLAEFICDLVSTGTTLLRHQLEELHVIRHFEAVLAVSPRIPSDRIPLLESIMFRFRAVLEAQESKYVMLNAPNSALPRIFQILPGLRAPTVLPLGMEGWSAVHAVVQQNRFWEIIDQLREAGAREIVVMPIEKLIR